MNFRITFSQMRSYTPSFGGVVLGGFLAFGVLGSACASAQTQVTAPIMPTPAPSPTPGKAVSFSGFGDLGFVDVFHTDKVRFKNGNQSRVFDGVEGPFVNPLTGALYAKPYDFNGAPVLNNLNVQATINGRFGGAIEASFGTDADFIASIGQPRSEANVTQAYLRYISGPFTFLAGKLEALAGFEAIESPRNPNYSHSYLSGFAVPGTVTGLRFTYSPSRKLSMTLGANDGWDDLTFNGKGLTFEGNISITASPAVTLSLTTYNGNDYTGRLPTTGMAQGNRTLYDAILQGQISKRLLLVVNYDDGVQHNAVRLDRSGAPNPGEPASTVNWSGIVGYAVYSLSPNFKIAFRAETFRDNGGFRTGYDQRLQSRTATLSYSPSAHLIFRAEYRTDTSDEPVFQQRPNLAITPGRAYQNSIGYEGLVLF